MSGFESSLLQTSPLLQQVAEVIPQNQPVYLVGGAVRDIFLKRASHDLDFALPGEALKLARRVGDALQGAYFPLNVEHDTGRVILIEDETRYIIDFTRFRGPNLESDLRARDLTINALALDIHDPSQITDPLGGLRDLRAGVLRACSERSFTDDPLRIIRVIRMAVAFGYQILPETRRLMEAALPGLHDISPERLRDELFNLLEAGSPATGVQLLDHFGALPYTFPELADLKGVAQSEPHIYNVWDHTLRTARELNRILGVLGPVHDEEASADLLMGLLVQRLGRYRGEISPHLLDRITPERSLQALLTFAGLYHDVGKPATQEIEDGRIRFLEHPQVGAEIAAQRARQLSLSNRETQRVETIVRHHMRPLLLVHTGKAPTRRAVYRFFRATGPAGVDICLLSLADTLATYGQTLTQDTWLEQLTVVRMLLEAWWEQRESNIDPIPLLGGKDLMEELGLKPGPDLGLLLDYLCENQATGEIETRAEALELAKKWLESNN